MWRSRRWLILAVGVPVYTCILWAITVSAIVLLNSPADFFSAWDDILEGGEEVWGEPLMWIWCIGPVLTIVATQLLIVVPLVILKPESTARPRSLTLSIVACACVAGLLCAALVCGLLELWGLWDRLSLDADLGSFGWPVTMPLLAVSWLFWSALLLRFSGRRRTVGFVGRLIGILLAGTLLESLLIIPIDVMVRRRTDCYCATGTFHSLLLSVFAVMWLTGPGVLILLTRHHHRRWAATHCLNCGYAKGPTPGDKCPECGYLWR